VTEDEALSLAILALYATFPRPADLRLAHIDLAAHMPVNMRVTKKLEKKFREALATTPPMDQFMAAKSYLGRVRRVEGFGAESFRVVYADVSFGIVAKPIPDVTVLVGPCSLVFEPPSKHLEPIPYRKLVDFESMGEHLRLRFVNQAQKVITIDLKSKDISTVQMLISYNIKIIRDLMLAKQRHAGP
jgi:hypothetical protein